MRIGYFVEVLEILPEETRGLGPDGDAQRQHHDGHGPVVRPRVNYVDDAVGRSTAYAS